LILPITTQRDNHVYYGQCTVQSVMLQELDNFVVREHSLKLKNVLN